MACNDLLFSPMLNTDEQEHSSHLPISSPLQETLSPLPQSLPVSSLLPSPSPLPSLCQVASIMPLPPEAIYSSSDELYAAIQAHAKQHNYAFVRGKSRIINQHGWQKVVYSCDWCKNPPPEFRPKTTGLERKRRTSSRATGCLFSVNAVQICDTQWELRHRPNQQYAVHNHPPSNSWTSHPSHQHFDMQTKKDITQLRNAGKMPIYSHSIIKHLVIL